MAIWPKNRKLVAFGVLLICAIFVASIVLFCGTGNRHFSEPQRLETAIRMGNLAEVKRLHEHGTAFSECGSPLALAASHGHLELTQYLVQQGVKYRGIDDMFGPGYDYEGGLLFAAIPHADVVRYLMEQGYTWEYGCMFDEEEPQAGLHYAKLKPGENLLHHTNSIRITKFLVESLHMDVNTPDAFGRTPLHLAIFRACHEEKDEDSQTFDKELGLTPCLAMYSVTLAQYLLRNGADPQKRDAFGKIPQDYANEEYIQLEQQLKKFPDKFFEQDWDDSDSVLKMQQEYFEETGKGIEKKAPTDQNVPQQSP